MADFSPNVPPPPASMWPQAPQGGGTGFLGNPVDLLGKVQNLHTQELDQQRRQIEIDQAREGAALATFGNLPNDPDKIATDDDIDHATASAVRRGADPARARDLGERLKSIKDPAARAREIGITAGLAMSPGEFAGRIQYPVGPGGEARTGTLGESRVPGAGGAGPPGGAGSAPGTGAGGPGVARSAAGTFTTSLPSGEPEAQQAASKQAQELEGSAQETTQYATSIDLLRRFSKHLRDDPTAPWGPTEELEKNVNAVAKRVLGPNTGWISASSLTNMNEFNKVVNLLAAGQARFGSNFALSHSIASNPSLLQDPEARENIIAQLQGLNDWRQQLRKEWMASPQRKTGRYTFNDWINQSMPDQGVFMFNRMSPTAKKQYYNDITDPAEQQRFEERYLDAANRGWVRNPGAP